MKSPILTAPRKISTLEMVASTTDAFASIVMDAGAEYSAFKTGVTIDTEGILSNTSTLEYHGSSAIVPLTMFPFRSELKRQNNLM